MKQIARTILLAVSILIATSQLVRADDGGGKEVAQRLLGEGNELLAKGDNNGALAKFEAAYEAYPSPSLLLNIGTTLRALGRNAEAANAYARWVRARQNPERLAEVEEVLAELDRLVGLITIEVNQAAATVRVDERDVSETERSGPVRLEPGSHVFVAAKKGFVSARREMSVVAGKRETVSLDLKPLPATDTKPGDDDDGDDDDDDDNKGTVGGRDDRGGGSNGRVLRIAGIATGVAGLALVGVGVKFGFDASRIQGEIQDDAAKRRDNGLAWDDVAIAALVEKEKDGKSAATKLAIFTAIGGAAVVAGGVLYVMGHMAKSDDESEFAIAPMVTGDSMGWALSGSF